MVCCQTMSLYFIWSDSFTDKLFKHEWYKDSSSKKILFQIFYRLHVNIYLCTDSQIIIHVLLTHWFKH